MFTGRSVQLRGANGATVGFSLDKDSAFVFKGISGQGHPPVTVFTTFSPSQHGAHREEALLEPRTLAVEGYVTSPSGLTGEASRREMDRNLLRLNAILGQLEQDLEVTYENAAGRYVAYGAAQAAPSYGARQLVHGRHLTLVRFSLLCTRPLWYEETEQVHPLRYNARGLKFPLRLPTSLGKGGYRRTIVSASGVPVPLILEILGPAEKPSISNTTRGESLRLTRPLYAGERLVIDTDPRACTVTFYDRYGKGESAMGYLDGEAEGFAFLQLYPGENRLLFESGDELHNATVTLKWRQAFVGV